MFFGSGQDLPGIFLWKNLTDSLINILFLLTLYENLSGAFARVKVLNPPTSTWPYHMLRLPRSSLRYWMASATNSAVISFSPSRSAMVRAIFRMRLKARADRPSLSMAASSKRLEAVSTGQYFLMWRLPIWALQ